MSEEQAAKMRAVYERKLDVEKRKASKVDDLFRRLRDEHQVDVTDVDDLLELVVAKKKQDTDTSELDRRAKRAERELETMRATIAERDSALKRLEDSRRAEVLRREVQRVADEIGAYGDEVHAIVMRDRLVGFDEDGELAVLNSKGEPEHAKTIKDAIKNMVAERKQLLKPTSHGGVGSQPPRDGRHDPDMRDPATRRAALLEVVNRRFGT